MTRRTESILFTVGVNGVLLVFLALAWGLDSRVPALVVGGALALTGFQLAREINTPDSGAGGPEPFERSGFSWALALPPAIYLLGCVAALGVHTTLFVRLRGQRSWSLSVACGLLAALPAYFLARLMLRPELLMGVLWGGF